MDHLAHQVNLAHLDHKVHLVDLASQDLKVHLDLLEIREIMGLWVLLGQLDHLAVMENLVPMAKMVIKENKGQLVHKDQGYVNKCNWYMCTCHHCTTCMPTL